MFNKLFESTYSKLIPLPHENNSFIAGISWNKLGLGLLKERYETFLHLKERWCLDTLQYLKRQPSYLLGRYCAKHALFSFSNFKRPTEVPIENSVFQQPIIHYSTHYTVMHNKWQVSISHIDTLGAAIFFLRQTL